MHTFKKLGFFLFLVFLVKNTLAQHDHDHHDQKDILRAEKLLSVFDQKFKTIVQNEIISGADYDLFYGFAQDQIGRDRRLFFGKVLHREIEEQGIEQYIEKNLVRIYKNLFSDFLSRKDSFKNTKETFEPELAGDPCNNVDFEAGTTIGWQGWTGIASTNPYPPNSFMIPGFSSSQHEILTGVSYDPIVGGTLLPRVAPGGNHSLRLENTIIGGQMARISQTFLVNPANANFTYRYAVVLEDPTDSHTDPERPFFRIRVTDGSGNEILCGRYEVIAKPPIVGFQQVPNSNYYWRDWTSVSIPLASYVGQNVTVEFTASDCSLTGHLGYAYIDGSCFQSSITSIPSGSCGGLPYTLIAPAGYAAYAWTGPGIVGANNVQTITVNQTGTYTCVITSVSGPTCKATLKAIVGASSTVNAGPDFHICSGGYAQLNATLSLTNSFSWSPTTGLTNPNTLNPIARPSTTTTYYLTACGLTDSATVYVDPVDFTISPPVTICGASPVTLSATPSVAGSYAYLWSPGTGLADPTAATQTVTPTSTTTYSVTVTNLNTGCSETKQVTVTVSSTGGSTSAGTDKTYCSSPVQLNASGGTSFTWTDINGNPPAGLSCTNCSNPLASPAATTSYIVASNLTAPCVNKDTVTVTVGTISAGTDVAICRGDTTSLNVISSMAAPITYTWTPSAGLNNPAIANPKASPSINTSYVVSASNGTCTLKDTVEVSMNVSPVVNLGDDATLCIGAAIILDAGNAGATFRWSTGATGQTLNVTTGGIYWVEVDNGICKARDSIRISYRTNPVVDLGADVTVCTGTSMTLNAGNAGSTYSWSTGTTSQTISVSAAGNYWVDVDNGVCPVVRDSMFISNINTPIVNLGTDVKLCVGTPIVLNAGNAGSAYTWSTGASGQTLNVTTGGIYWVDVDNGSCPKVRDSITVTYKTVPLVALSADVTLCTGTSMTLNAGNVGSTYNWSTGATSQTISASAAGYYWVDVDNGVCPIVRDSILINNINTPIVNLGTDVTLCVGTPIVLNAGNAGSAYTWSTGASGQTLNVTTGGIYWVDVDNGSCPKVRDSINVTYKPVPVVNIGNDTTLCVGQLKNLDAGNVGATFLWSTGATSQTIIAVTQGHYWVDVNNGACPTVRDSMYLTVLSFPVVNLGPDRTQCITSLISLDAGNAGYPKIWSTSATGSVITPGTSGIYWVDVNNGQCVTRDSVSITYVPVATVNFGNDTTVCNGTNVGLTVLDPGVSYQWSTGATSQSIAITSAGTYWVDVDNGYCTVIRYNVDVSYVNPPVVNLGIDSANVCLNDTITLNAANNGATFTWYNLANAALSTSQQIQLFNNVTGYYWVEVNNGVCTRRDSVYIRFPAYPDPLRDTTVCFEQQIVFHAGEGFQWYLWQDSSTASTYTASVVDLIADTIKVKIQDLYGCIYLDSMILSAIDCREEELFIPNLITPNGDYQNDQFHIRGLPDASELFIHNRWGDLIYRNSDYDNKWGASGVSDGVYYYLLKFRDGREFKGWLQIIN